MASPLRWIPLMAAIILTAGGVSSYFLASDLIYIPLAVLIELEDAPDFRTDLYITNVDDVDIDVMVTYIPSGLTNNGGRFLNRSQWLGGRESDGFGFVNEDLADIPPNGSVSLVDVVGQYWPDDVPLTGIGAMVIFAYEADSLEDDGTRVFRNAVAQARIYQEATVLELDPDSHIGFIERDVTYGFSMPGAPWYGLADGSAINDNGDFTFQVLVGGTKDENLWYDVGLFNTSDIQTALTVRVQPLQADGQPFLNDNDNELFDQVLMPPMSNFRYNDIMGNRFGIDQADVFMVKVSIVGWTTTASDPVPSFTSYGSIVDGRSFNQTTVVPSFGFPFDVECQFPPNEEEVPPKGDRRPGQAVSAPPYSSLWNAPIAVD